MTDAWFYIGLIESSLLFGRSLKLVSRANLQYQFNWPSHWQSKGFRKAPLSYDCDEILSAKAAKATMQQK